MQLFDLNKELSILCLTANTRNGFKHTATLMRQGRGLSDYKTKICYLNRTWEAFTYQSVLNAMLRKLLETDRITKRQHNAYYKKFNS